MKFLGLLFSLLVSLSFGTQALAFPMPKGHDNHGFIMGNDQYHFDGIVSLDDCSGSIIRFDNSKPTDPAMVLTNGHCLESGMPRPNTFVYHEKSKRQFGVFDDHAKLLGRLNAVGIIYSSMTKTDITLYQLSQSYQDIFNQYKVHPFLLSSQHPVLGTPIEVISGYWRRGYTCAINGFVNELREGGYSMFDSVRYSQPGCEIIGGTSGSPVVQNGTRTVVAINNTTNENGGRCTMDNPCEVDASGNVTAIRGNSYAQETYIIYSCVNQTNQFDLATPGCLLYH